MISPVNLMGMSGDSNVMSHQIWLRGSNCSSVTRLHLRGLQTIPRRGPLSVHLHVWHSRGFRNVGLIPSNLRMNVAWEELRVRQGFGSVWAPEGVKRWRVCVRTPLNRERSRLITAAESPMTPCGSRRVKGAPGRPGIPSLCRARVPRLAVC